MFRIGRKIGKKVLGTGLIAAIILLVATTAYLSTSSKEKEFAETEVAGLTIGIGFLLAILLLPSLRRFKVAGVEMETEPVAAKNVELVPLSGKPIVDPFRKYVKILF
jgi:Na+-translocating ferredoxin:NAD+ oxidoreductase RnfA subunit